MTQAGVLVLTLRRVRSAVGNIQAGIALPIPCTRESHSLMTSFLVFNDFLFEVCFVLDLPCNLLSCVLVIWISLPMHSDVHWILSLLGEFCTSRLDDLKEMT